ncbi:hypothetical protein DITRI_Ditri03aG0188200 [Diplodiscus trichospermus]
MGFLTIRTDLRKDYLRGRLQLYKSQGKRKGKDRIQREGNDEGRNNLASGVKELLKKCIPNSKVVMNHAKCGLYAGRHIQFGNRISEDGGNKSRGSWKPNIQKKRLFSYILDRHIRVKVTTHALLCIGKVGGIDEYLLKKWAWEIN